MSDEPLKVGLLGVGAIAQIVHLPVLATLDVEVVGVCDVAHGTARSIADRFGVRRVYASDDELMNDADLQAVIICTPNYLHEQQAIQALNAGKHVLVERPLALDADGAERVVATAEKHGRTLMVALNHRYRPDMLAVRPFVRNGELGDIYFARAGWYHRKMPVKRQTWRHRKATSGGGALMDLGIQALDACLWLLDYPPVERVTAHAHPGAGMEVEDAATLLVRIAGGIISTDVTWSMMALRDRQSMRLLGTAGSATVGPLGVHKEMDLGLVDVTPHLTPEVENAYTASYREQVRHFVAAARGEASAELPREQIQLMRLVRMAYESIDTGREVRA
ncbi:MAG: Gfo/Idh/MocA family oxidoreductase [Gemmatimonadota bacterium]|jgi:predicted dehydrogenase